MDDHMNNFLEFVPVYSSFSLFGSADEPIGDRPNPSRNFSKNSTFYVESQWGWLKFYAIVLNKEFLEILFRGGGWGVKLGVFDST